MQQFTNFAAKWTWRNCSWYTLLPPVMPSISWQDWLWVTNDNDLEGTFTFSKAANLEVSFDKISANKYFACYYDSNWWAGLVQNKIVMKRMLKWTFYTLQDPQIALLGQRKKTFVGYHIWMWYVKSDPQQHQLDKHF